MAVNSGYVYFDVYMNVNSEIARLYGLDFSVKFNKNLTLIKVEGSIFDVSTFTPLDVANTNHTVTLVQDMGLKAVNKEFAKGKYLFTTLVFKVDAAFCNEIAAFEIVPGAVARDDEDCFNELMVDFGVDTHAQINVQMLGDANSDGFINSKDMLVFAKWYVSAGIDDYNTIIDLNKDGYIDGDDFVLLRCAVVGDDTYLEF